VRGAVEAKAELRRQRTIGVVVNVYLDGQSLDARSADVMRAPAAGVPAHPAQDLSCARSDVDTACSLSVTRWKSRQHDAS